MKQPPLKPTVGIKEVEKQISLYADCWNRFLPENITIPSEVIHNIHIEGLGSDCDEFLIIRKFDILQLTYEAFRSLPILLLDTQQYQVSPDNFYYWAFAADTYEFLNVNLWAKKWTLL